MFFEAEFFTSDHVIQGHVETPQERLSDLLNWKNETSIIVHEAKISRLLALGKMTPINMIEARLEKSAILLAHPVERDMTAKSIYRRATRIVSAVTVLMPYFEVTGLAHLTEKFELRRVLLSRPDDFIPLTNAMATYTLYPTIRVGPGTIIFNKNRMVLIGERLLNGQEGDPLKNSQQATG